MPLVRAALPPEVAVIVAGKLWTHADAEAALARAPTWSRSARRRS